MKLALSAICVLGLSLSVSAQETPPTEKEIGRVIRAAGQVEEQSQGSLATLGGLNSPTPPFPILIAEASFVGQENSIHSHRLNIASPIYKGEDTTWNAELAGGYLTVLGDSPEHNGQSLPHDLRRLEMGIGFEKNLSGHRRFGVKVSAGSAGDKIFDSYADSTFSVNMTYGYPTETGNYWMWFVFASNNNAIANFVPIPGVMYIVRKPNFTGMFGMPIISLQWTLSEKSSYSFSMMGPAITSEYGYGSELNFKTFAAFNWTNQSFVLHNRVDEKDRLLFEDKRFAVGIRSLAFGRMILEAQTGFAFDREVYSGQGFRDFRRGRSKLEDSLFASLSLKSRLWD